MKVRDLSAAHGWYWVRDAFKLFAKSPALWIALMIVMIIIWIIADAVPFIGPLAVGIAYPLFIAGLMAGARKIEQGDELELADLFTAFRANQKPLVTIGIISLVLQILLMGALMLAGFKEPPTPVAGQPPDIALIQNYLDEVKLPLLIGAALWLPLTMALWFVPPLLMFNKKLSAVDAIKWSFYACVANFVPFLIYGLVFFGLSMLLPFTLFLGVIVMIPVLVITIYTAYKDIFDESEPAAAINPPENV